MFVQSSTRLEWHLSNNTEAMIVSKAGGERCRLHLIVDDLELSSTGIRWKKHSEVPAGGGVKVESWVPTFGFFGGVVTPLLFTSNVSTCQIHIQSSWRKLQAVHGIGFMPSQAVPSTTLSQHALPDA